MLQWHIALIDERRCAQERGRLMRRGVTADPRAPWLALDMTAYMVVVNLRDEPLIVPLPAPADGGTIVLADDPTAELRGREVSFGARGVVVVRRP